MHKKIMEKCSSKLMKDAKHYDEDSKRSKSKKNKSHDMTEKKEATQAAKKIKKLAIKAHEY